MSTMRSTSLHVGLQRFIDAAQDNMREDNTVAAKLNTEFASELAQCLYDDGLAKGLLLVDVRNIANGPGKAAEKLERIQDAFDNFSTPL